MNYSTAKTILHLYRKKQKKSAKKIKEENRCSFRCVNYAEKTNNLEVIVTQGGKFVQKNTQNNIWTHEKPIAKPKAKEDEKKYMDHQFHLKILLAQYKLMQMKTTAAQKKEIIPSQINQNSKNINTSALTCKKNVIIIKPACDI